LQGNGDVAWPIDADSNLDDNSGPEVGYTYIPWASASLMTIQPNETSQYAVSVALWVPSLKLVE
jgi:hypothetical protein